MSDKNERKPPAALRIRKDSLPAVGIPRELLPATPSAAQTRRHIYPLLPGKPEEVCLDTLEAVADGGWGVEMEVREGSPPLPPAQPASVAPPDDELDFSELGGDNSDSGGITAAEMQRAREIVGDDVSISSSPGGRFDLPPLSAGNHVRPGRLIKAVPVVVPPPPVEAPPPPALTATPAPLRQPTHAMWVIIAAVFMFWALPSPWMVWSWRAENRAVVASSKEMVTPASPPVPINVVSCPAPPPAPLCPVATPAPTTPLSPLVLAAERVAQASGAQQSAAIAALLQQLRHLQKAQRRAKSGRHK